MWYWYQNRHTDQWNRIENPEINPDAYGQLIFDKVGKNIKWERTVSSASIVGKTGQDTIKFLEENIGKTFSDIHPTNVFSGQSPKAIEIKAKINPWDLIKLKSFCTAKESKMTTKGQLREWEKTVSNDATDRGLISKIQTTYTTQQQKNQQPN